MVGVPEAVVFRTKPLIAAEQIRQAVAEGVPRAPVVAEAAYGKDTKFRQALLDMGLEYAAGIQPTFSVWPPGKEPLPPKPRKSIGRPPELRQRAPNHQPVLAKDLADALAPKDSQTVPWRDGTKKKLQSRFAAVCVRPADRDCERSGPLPEQWLLIEWLEDEAEPTKYWLGSLTADTRLTALGATAKQRVIIGQDYDELKQEFGLGHY
jgi:SRSO17 transposase